MKIHIINTINFYTISYTDVIKYKHCSFSPDSSKLLIVQHNEQTVYDLTQNTIEELEYKHNNCVCSAKFISNEIVLMATNESTIIQNLSTKPSIIIPTSSLHASLASDGIHLVMSGSSDFTGKNWDTENKISIYNINTLHLQQTIPIANPLTSCLYANKAFAHCNINDVPSDIITCDKYTVCVWN